MDKVKKLSLKLEKIENEREKLTKEIEDLHYEVNPTSLVVARGKLELDVLK